jgi:tRNA pseudouridine55 synthase
MSRRPSRPHARDIDGLILLDKPYGESSNGALQKVRRLFNARKAGHTGSLDPLATGLLPVCLGEATKVSRFFLDADKGYEVVAQLGVRSNTGDLEGDLSGSPEDAAQVSEAQLQEALVGLRGVIKQRPPLHSAVKRDGKRLYEHARKGREVERPIRQVSIFQLDWLDGPVHRPRLVVRCSKGTYIRSLVEDLGEALGCGAHVAELRRTGMAGFDGLPMMGFAELQARAESGAFDALDSLLMPMDAALHNLPGVALDDAQAHAITHGQFVSVELDPAAENFRMYAPGDQFIGIGRRNSEGLLAPARLLARKATQGA